MEKVEERVLVLGYASAEVGGILCDIHTGELKIIPNFSQDSAIETTAAILNSLSPTNVLLPARLYEELTAFIQEKSTALNYVAEVLSSKSYRLNSSDGVIDFLVNRNSCLGVKAKSLLNSVRSDSSLSVSRTCFYAMQNSVNAILMGHGVDNSSLASNLKVVSIFQADSLMYLSEDAFLDLQILKKTPEQRCLLDLFIHNAGSALGQRYLRNLFKAPVSDIAVINMRLEVVETLLQDDNSIHFEDIRTNQKGIGDIHKILNALNINKLQLTSWNKIKSLIHHSIQIIYAIGKLRSSRKLAALHDIFDSDDLNVLQSLDNDIEVVIDFEESILNQRVYVKDGFNEELDDARAKYNELERKLAEFANIVCQNNSDIPSDALNVVYIPQLGYLTSVDRSAVSLEYVPQDWKEVFTTASNWYFKEQITEEADENYGDVYQTIVDGEIEIITQLQMEVLEHEKTIIKVCLKLAELDCYCAIAQTSLHHGFMKPQIINSPILNIKQGRNPLSGDTLNSFIPNDTVTPEKQISIITGANGSGKSVYLVQIGIIVYLSHIGSYVPAESAQIGIVDKLLTKLITHESIERCQSTFFIDLQKIANCIHQKTDQSILLVDEFGKGTDVIGGPALLGAIIEHLNEFKPGRCFMTTHFHDLFKDNILQYVGNVKHYHMDVLFTDQASKNLTCLYTLKDGLATDSFGIICAENHGIPSNITRRAWEILRSEKLLKDDCLDERKVNEAVSIVIHTDYK